MAWHCRLHFWIVLHTWWCYFLSCLVITLRHLHWNSVLNLPSLFLSSSIHCLLFFAMLLSICKFRGQCLDSVVCLRKSLWILAILIRPPRNLFDKSGLTSSILSFINLNYTILIQPIFYIFLQPNYGTINCFLYIYLFYFYIYIYLNLQF